MQRILAISSGGGHWEQLRLSCAALGGGALHCLATLPDPALPVGTASYHQIRDCNKQAPLALLICAAQIARHIARLRPDIILTTGAAPGVLAIALGRLCGAHTIWIDSLANAEQLSLSGRLARPIAHLHLTQWPHLARPEVTRYMGAVL